VKEEIPFKIEGLPIPTGAAPEEVKENHFISDNELLEEKEETVLLQFFPKKYQVVSDQGECLELI
jgi:hypothetical protein